VNGDTRIEVATVASAILQMLLWVLWSWYKLLLSMWVLLVLKLTTQQLC